MTKSHLSHDFRTKPYRSKSLQKQWRLARDQLIPQPILEVGAPICRRCSYPHMRNSSTRLQRPVQEVLRPESTCSVITDWLSNVSIDSSGFVTAEHSPQMDCLPKLKTKRNVHSGIHYRPLRFPCLAIPRFTSASEAVEVLVEISKDRPRLSPNGAWMAYRSTVTGLSDWCLCGLLIFRDRTILQWRAVSSNFASLVSRDYFKADRTSKAPFLQGFKFPCKPYIRSWTF